MPVARRVAAIAVAAYLLLVFIDRFVLVKLFAMRVGLPILLAALVALACVGVGFLVRGRRGGIATNLAIGYPIFGTICFVVGAMKISNATMMPIVVIFGIAGVLSLKDAGPIAGAPLSLAMIAIIVFGVLEAQAPPASLDELAYHLAIPWSWVKEGRAVDLPLISHSYFPLGVESADLPLFTAIGIDAGIA